MIVRFTDNRLWGNSVLLGLELDKEYEVEQELKTTVCGKEHPIYIINGKPFDSRRFILVSN